MAARIARHRAERPGHWQSVEAPLDLAGILEEQAGAGRCLIVDCLTLWLTNLLASEEEIDEERFQSERTALLELLPSLPGHTILVGNEISMGVVPLGALSRRFCDENGRLHQAIAALADRVTLVAAGLPLTLKGIG
jgi:adenosylcobinamide kinase/adenosylcobinamide-phosphate guanylyltransferase